MSRWNNNQEGGGSASCCGLCFAAPPPPPSLLLGGSSLACLSVVLYCLANENIRFPGTCMCAFAQSGRGGKSEKI